MWVDPSLPGPLHHTVGPGQHLGLLMLALLIPAVEGLSITHIVLIQGELDYFFHGAAGFLRGAVAKTMQLRATPKLHFVYDKSVRHGQQLDALIEKAVFDDQSKRSESEKGER